MRISDVDMYMNNLLGSKWGWMLNRHNLKVIPVKVKPTAHAETEKAKAPTKGSLV
ncbi:hypothetical protein GCM10023095_18040 [Pseudaeromonas paramecii]|uniref:Uncharacterized protein n=1 Tax=Pseudaeromonas paramecii TaxID=2138166 RepID=A0ABP8QBN3_9GAMM